MTKEQYSDLQVGDIVNNGKSVETMVMLTDTKLGKLLFCNVWLNPSKSNFDEHWYVSRYDPLPARQSVQPEMAVIVVEE